MVKCVKYSKLVFVFLYSDFRTAYNSNVKQWLLKNINNRLINCWV